jgi:hypothetical protein
MPDPQYKGRVIQLITETTYQKNMKSWLERTGAPVSNIFAGLLIILWQRGRNLHGLDFRKQTSTVVLVLPILASA